MNIPSCIGTNVIVNRSCNSNPLNLNRSYFKIVLPIIKSSPSSHNVTPFLLYTSDINYTTYIGIVCFSIAINRD